MSSIRNEYVIMYITNTFISFIYNLYIISQIIMY